MQGGRGKKESSLNVVVIGLLVLSHRGNVAALIWSLSRVFSVRRSRARNIMRLKMTTNRRYNNGANKG